MSIFRQPEKFGGATDRFRMVNVNSRGITIPVQGNWHLERKKAILKAHPEVKDLFGTDKRSAFWTIVFFVFLTWLAVWAATLPWWQQLVVAYTVGAWACFCLITLAHEGVHGLVFGYDPLDRLCCIIGFTPAFLGPMAMFWQTEHIWHHTIVVDKVLRFGPQDSNVLKKLLAVTCLYAFINAGFGLASFCLMWVMLAHMVLYAAGRRESLLPKTSAIPPFNRFPQVLNLWFLFNCFFSFGYIFSLYFLYGWGPVMFLMFLTSTANGLHPLGMRNVQEHYYMKKDQPTTSVYTGAINDLTFNIGLHVEHHDFNTIPHSRLYRLREIAPEFYMNLFHYRSYTEVLIRFFTDPGIPLQMVFEGNPLFEME